MMKRFLDEPAPGAALLKIVLNLGVSGQGNAKVMDLAAEELAAIAGQRPKCARRKNHFQLQTARRHAHRPAGGPCAVRVLGVH